MNEDRPSGPVQEGRPRSWLERIGQMLQSEPKDKDDLRHFLHDAQERALLDHDAVTMIEGVMDVSEMQVRDIMIPRSQMEVIERDAGLDQFLPIIIESAHSRFPVIGENRDEVIGIILAKDLLPFAATGSNGEFNIREILRPALVVPESKRLNVLLREFQTSHNHMAIVVDEYGGVAGLVTIEDVLEQIVGEIEDEHDVDDEESYILPAGGGRYSVRALTPIEDFNEYFHTGFSDEEFDTIAGLVLNAFGRMPKRGESVDFSGFRFTVQRADNRRIYLLEVARVAVESADNQGDVGPAEDGPFA
jgi:magnesium and cobalt transporter